MFSFSIFSLLLIDNFFYNILNFLTFFWPIFSSPFIFCEFIFFLTFLSFILNILLLLLNTLQKLSHGQKKSNNFILSEFTFIKYSTYFNNLLLSKIFN